MSAAAPLRRPFGLRATGAAQAAPAAPATRTRPRLVLVAPARSVAGRLPFVILIGAVLVSGLLVLLMLHTLAAQDGFKVSALQRQLSTLTDTEQGLQLQVQGDSAPGALRARAGALGMVPSTVSSYRKLHGGRAIGLQQPVIAPPPTVPTSTVPTSTVPTSTVPTSTVPTSTVPTSTVPTSKSATKPGSGKASNAATAGATTHRHRHQHHHSTAGR
jgi:hypothetical protein